MNKCYWRFQQELREGPFAGSDLKDIIALSQEKLPNDVARYADISEEVLTKLPLRCESFHASNTREKKGAILAHISRSSCDMTRV